MRKNVRHTVLPVVLILIALGRIHGWADEARIRAATASVNGVRITQADQEPGNWLTHGRTYAEQRYSPLRQIHADNIAQLGLAWFYDTHTSRGLEGTPLAVDGILYATGPWSVVYAIDGRTGKRLWEYDPQVPRPWAKYACCDVVNRGAALWQGKVYVGTIDGRLVALDAATGRVVWEMLTIDPGKPHTITGAPRIVKGKVIIGNGGAEFGVRGYVSAYDAETGALLWRFYTVPGDPSRPFENAAMARAATTWHGRQWWIVGGGGTVWDSLAAVTISTWRQFWPCGRITATSSGITRRPPATPGTIPPPST